MSRHRATVTINEVVAGKRRYLPLLLLADEQEDMVERYLDRGRMFVLEEDRHVVAECVVTDEGDGVLEVKNLAVKSKSQGKGYGRMLIDFVAQTFRDRFSTLQVGTGESPLTLPFYERCGFHHTHRVKDFFTEHYDHPIFEGGVQLVDMVYLQRTL